MARAALIDGPAFASLAIQPDMFQVTDDGTVNPVRSFNNVPGYGSLTVSYGPYFQGQSASDPFSPPIAVSGAPSGPLALTTNTDLQTVVEVDNNLTTANQEVLGGVPTPATNGFGGPVAILFSQAVTGVTLTAGSFDATGSTTIEAFTGAGLSLGTVTNLSIGYEVFNLSDDTGLAIQGLLITTTDAAGFGINGVGIEASAATPIPEPASWGLLAVMVMMLALIGKTTRLPE